MSHATIRPAAVAGRFYPVNPDTLATNVDAYIAATQPCAAPARLLIAPHAGYDFSGAVAGAAYASVAQTTRRVFVIGPAHHSGFPGFSISTAEAWETPLGPVPLDTEVIAALRTHPLVTFSPEADSPEHSIEVQLPFLQRCLAEFTLVPILTCRRIPEELAALLLPWVDNNTLFVASSDLSHFLADIDARVRDASTLASILSLNRYGAIEGCGDTAVRALLIMAKQLGLMPIETARRNSSQTAAGAGSTDHVVGYAAVVFVDGPGGADFAPPRVSATTRAMLIDCARRQIEAVVRNQHYTPPPRIPDDARFECGCFVTLTRNKQLRGCLGSLEATLPLFYGVIENAREAARNDHRFPPVRPEELGDLCIGISVIGELRYLQAASPTELIAAIWPGRDGLVLEKGGKKATFLPQVWNQLTNPVEFLEQLALKAGLAQDDWKNARIGTYSVEHFDA